VFDTLNDARMLLEGRLLQRALSAQTVTEAREFARQFVALRAARHRVLGHSLAEFEQKAEGNEGLAEYALFRTRNAIDGQSPAAPPASLLQDLEQLTSDPVRSFRLRYYSLGSAQAFLLDRLDPKWKTSFLHERVYLDELLARASGARTAEDQALRAAASRERFTVMLTDAGGNLARLRDQRVAQIDSIMSRPGLQLIIELSALPNRDVGWCGIDPQNLLQAGQRVLIHTRWLRACSGNALDAEFNTPAIQDRAAGQLKAVIESDLRITAQGEPVALEAGKAVELSDVRLESHSFNAHFTRAELRREGSVLRITPRI
jgi:hypothetical protein